MRDRNTGVNSRGGGGAGRGICADAGSLNCVYRTASRGRQISLRPRAEGEEDAAGWCPQSGHVGEKRFNIAGLNSQVGPARLLRSFLTLDPGLANYSPRARSDPLSVFFFL